MITAAEIREASFGRAARGYRMIDVDDLLEQAADTIEQLHNENRELVHKLEVLADRIQEYRNEEDSIRSALLTAQKSADKILKEATDEKERLLDEARQQADESLRLSQEKSVTIANETREKVSLVLNEAKEKASRLLTEAKDKSDHMLAEALEGCKAEKEYLEFLKEQEEKFRQQVVEMYKKQFEMLKKGPEILKNLKEALQKEQEPLTLQTAQEITKTEIPVSQPDEPTYTEPEDIPLPVAEAAEALSENDAETAVINDGFEIKHRFGDLKFGDDYDIASDDDYEV